MIALERSAQQIIAEIRRLGIRGDMQVSMHSMFSDLLWDFYDSDNARLNSVSPAKLRIDWGVVGERVPEQFIFALKVVAFLYIYAPAALFARKARMSIKPHTALTQIRLSLAFFEHVIDRAEVEFLGWRATSLSDVSANMILGALSDFGRADQTGLKFVLKALTRPIFDELLGVAKVGWTAADIEQFSFRKAAKREDYERVYPAPMFRLLTEHCSAVLLGFLEIIGKRPVDTGPRYVPSALAVAHQRGLGARMYRRYVKIRLYDRDYRSKRGVKFIDSGPQRAEFAERFGVTIAEFSNCISSAHGSAITLIALYTGARYSDGITFTTGCLGKVSGEWFLRGTHVKHQPLDKPVNEDYWPAIPILQDAVTCLEMISQFTCNPYLLSSTRTVRTEQRARPFSLGGLIGVNVKVLREADILGRFAGVRISSQRFRHTLAHQLARAEVGLPFIAHQLKHLHYALERKVPATTLMYGGIANLKRERALQAGVHVAAAACAVFDPDSPIAGGGANEFRVRRRAYFEGLMAQGYSKEQILADLARQGLPFQSVGLAYCAGRREIRMPDGTSRKPPCMGSLQCTPEECGNAVITKEHVPVWIKVVKQNEELARRPEMAFARAELEDKSTVARRVLSDLGAFPSNSPSPR